MAVSGAILLGSLGIGAYAIKKKQDQADSRNLINTVVGGDDQNGKTADQWFVDKLEDRNGMVRDKKTGKVVSAVTHPLPLLKARAQAKAERLEGGPKRPKIPTIALNVAQSGMITNNV